MKQRGIIERVLMLSLGSIFVYAALDKISHPQAFAEIIHNYQILPGSLINVTAIILPWLEIIIGLLLITGRFMPGAASLCTLLLAAFWAALLFNLARGVDINCGCFSTQGGEQGTITWYVLRDTVFLAASLYLLFKTIKLKEEKA